MINHIYKPKGERIWRWKFRLHSTDGKIQDVSLGTSDKQVAEKTRGERLRENEHERAGLLPSRVVRNAAQRKLTEHLQDFLGDLHAKGRARDYISHVSHYNKALIADCGWMYPQDATADSFGEWRKAQSKSQKTLNEYLTSAKGFFTWLVVQGRIPANPLLAVQKGDARGRQVRPRRAYNDSEFAALLAVAGEQRIVYLTAALTGIRHGELKELCWDDFNLNGEKPSVTVRASVSKNHRQACLPLHPDLVAALLQFRPANAEAGELVFKGLVPRSEILVGHLKAANIAKTDSQGRVVDFHSLRHTFCTNLHRAGVSQREAMELMRHNDPRLTASTYTDTSLLSLRDAVKKLAVSPSQLASQILGAEGHLQSPPVADSSNGKSSKAIANKGGKSLSGAAWRILSKIEEWCLFTTPLELFFKDRLVLPRLEATGIEPFYPLH